MEFNLYHISFRYRIRSKLEKLALDLGVGGTFPNDFALLPIGEMLKKYPCNQIVGYVNKS